MDKNTDARILFARHYWHLNYRAYLSARRKSARRKARAEMRMAAGTIVHFYGGKDDK